MQQFLSQSKSNAFVLDVDGTLLRYDDAIDGSSNFLRFLQTNNIPHVFLSNTGEKTAFALSKKMSEVLNVDIDPKCICTAMDYMCDILKEEFLLNVWKTILVLSANDTWKEKLDIGIDFTSWKKPNNFDAKSTCIALLSDGNVPNYYENLKEISELMNEGVSFCASSEDDTIMKVKENKILKCPGPGMFIQLLKQLSEKKIRCFGKGSSECMSVKALQLIKEFGFKGRNDNIWFVGDRCDTDIRAGKNQGVKTCLVESGCHQESDIDDDIPDAIACSILDIMNSYSGLNDSTIRQHVQKFLSRLAFRSSNIVGNGIVKQIFKKIESQVHPAPRRVKSYPNMQCLK